MKKKQSSIDFFFAPKKDIKKESQHENTPVNNKIEIKKAVIKDTLISNIISRESSPPPTSSSDSFEFNISDKQKPGKKQNENNSLEDSHQILNEKNVIKPILDTDPSFSNINKEISQKEILLNSEEEKNLHWKLEVIEHRIQFGKDLDHPHPAMSPDILIKEGLQDIHPRENTRLKHYEQIKCIEYLPDFWESRCWDNEYPKLDRIQSEFLLQSMIEAPLKKKIVDESESESQYDYSSSSPSTNASSSSSDDEDDKCQIKNKKPKVRVGFNKLISNHEKRIVQKPVSLRLTSLLFDTDSDAETDLESF